MNTRKVVTLVGVVCGPHGVDVHPEFWEELQHAPPDVQQDTLDLIEHMRTATRIAYEKHGESVTEQDFIRELTILTGQEPEPLSDEDYKHFLEEEARQGEFPTRH